MARYHVRCSRDKCRARDVFAKHPDDYRTPRKCACCGGTKFCIIKDIIKHSGHIDCTCGGYRWGGNWTANPPPHRRGSRFCWFRRNGTQRMPGDADFDDPNYQESSPVEGEILRETEDATA